MSVWEASRILASSILLGSVHSASAFSLAHQNLLSSLLKSDMVVSSLSESLNTLISIIFGNKKKPFTEI